MDNTNGMPSSPVNPVQTGSVTQPPQAMPMPASATPVQPAMPQNQTFGQPAVAPGAQGASQSTGSSLDRAIALAMDIVARTQNNPIAQARELAALKASYLEEQHGVTPQG